MILDLALVTFVSAVLVVHQRLFRSQLLLLLLLIEDAPLGPGL
jgi:hypothetical protein